MMRSRRMKSASSASCSSATGDELAGRRMVGLGLLPRGQRIAAVDPRRDAAEFLLRLLQLARRDRQQAIGAEREPFVEGELLLEPLAAEAERALAARREVGLEKLDVGRDRGRRLGRRVGEIAEQVQIAQVGKRPRQIVVDEAERAAKALEPDLDEDAGRILDVVARRLHQARHLPQLGEDATRALGERRVVEERLAGEAGRQRVGEELRAALPRAHLFELEDARADARLERRSLEPLDVGQPRRVDRRQPPGEPAERADLRVNRRSAEVLEQVVVHVDAVEGGRRGVDLVEVRQVLVNEVRKGFG